MTHQLGPSSHHPLHGLRVVDLGEGAAASYCARLFADAGADVQKIEPPEGDPCRFEGPHVSSAAAPESSAWFTYLNRGKRSIVLDLSLPEDCERVKEMLSDADVLVHSSARLVDSLAWATPAHLLESYSSLVTVSVTPFGEKGPYAALPGDELIVSSLGGLLGASPGFPDYVLDPVSEPPLRADAHIAGLVGGAMGAIGGLMALSTRDKTGLGDYVEVSLQECVAALIGWNLSVYAYGGAIVGRHQVPARQAPNHYLPCADGWVALVAFMERHWTSLVELMGNPDWASSPEFATGVDRGANWQALEPLLVEWLVQQPAANLFKGAQERGIPTCPALSIEEAIGNEQARARDYFVPTGIEGDERGRLPGDPLVIDGQRRRSASSAPALGEGTGNRAGLAMESPRGL